MAKFKKYVRAKKPGEPEREDGWEYFTGEVNMDEGAHIDDLNGRWNLEVGDIVMTKANGKMFAVRDPAFHREYVPVDNAARRIMHYPEVEDEHASKKPKAS